MTGNLPLAYPSVSRHGDIASGLASFLWYDCDPLPYPSPDVCPVFIPGSAQASSGNSSSGDPYFHCYWQEESALDGSLLGFFSDS
jgi:hypothetical protein